MKKLFLIDDDESVVKTLSKVLKKEGYEVIAETRAFDNIIYKLGNSHPDVVLLDINLLGLSGLDILIEIKQKSIDAPVIMLTGDVTADTAVKSLKLGAADYITKPYDIDKLKIVISNILENESLKQEVDCLRRISSEHLDNNIIGESRVIKELQNKIIKIANVRGSSILITGESGTGKEVFSKYIHRIMNDHDKSRNYPFVAINCSALPEYLMESELFGHEKGAFTDAKAIKKGVFELAHGGSLLLDEIGEMNPPLQTKLLRVLEERTIRRIGGKWDIPVDVTVIASTNRNLSDAVTSGEFRSDLFFRLNQFYLHIPPLRERREDIPLLSRHFLSHYCMQYNKKMIKAFSHEAEKIMTAYSWPGNVRELKNLVQKIVVLENTEIILPEQLPDWLRRDSRNADKTTHKKFVLPNEGITLDEVKKDLFMQALEKAGNNKVAAAKLLNMSYDSYRYGLKKFGLI
jgi:DNA-binding NtrC family response regulator